MKVAEAISSGNTLSAMAVLSAIRVPQWAKNVLVFIPIFTSHKFGEFAVVWAGARSFLAFSLAASAVYLINDLVDLDADQAHPVKRSRAIPSGRISRQSAIAAAVALLLGAFGVVFTLPPMARYILAAYCALAMLYTFALKQTLLIDVLAVASFYTMRILFGGSATGIAISVWLLAFSIFTFLSIALVKRLAELQLLQLEAEAPVMRRAYRAVDLPQLASLASSSAYAAALVFALYVNSSEVQALYSRPRILWFVCPLLIYWLSRMLILARRGWLHDDPLLFAFKDPASWWTMAAVLGMVLVAL